MGYRSEVVAGVPLKDKRKALAIIKEWDAVGTGMLDTFWDKNPDGTKNLLCHIFICKQITGNGIIVMMR